jgi:hypothetical protein
MPAALILAAWVVGNASGQQTPKEWRQFTSVAGGYITHYPSGWHTFPPANLPTLNIYNFPFSRAGGGVLPDGGASIALVPAPARVATLEDWIKADSLTSKQESRSSIILRGVGSARLPVVEIVSRSSDDMEYVDCYFEIGGRLLVGRLIYWTGDPSAGKYRQALHEVIEGTRPLAR